MNGSLKASFHDEQAGREGTAYFSGLITAQASGSNEIRA